MDRYLEIRLLPDPEFNAPMLMGALYSKLHRALATLQSKSIGVSFPEYSRKPKSLGTVLRIHGDENALRHLQEMDWLKGMRDHSQASAIQPVPADAKHMLVQRRQFKTNAERLRRRRMKRKGESYEQVVQAIPDSVERKPDLPFLVLRSLSTGQAFHLFIDQGPPMDERAEGQFNCYGLSQQATVPSF
jgi:CRISPR-associated endonuclease Csy4